MHHPTGRITHTTAFVTPVVEHWLEQEIARVRYTPKQFLTKQTLTYVYGYKTVFNQTDTDLCLRAWRVRPYKYTTKQFLPNRH